MLQKAFYSGNKFSHLVSLTFEKTCWNQLLPTKMKKKKIKLIIINRSRNLFW